MQEYTFSKKDGADINDTKAQEWMKRFREKHPAKTDVIARFIGTDIIQTVLGQDQCVGMRIYFGYDEAGALQIIICGARADGSNIWPNTAGSAAVLADGTLACPPYCPR
jgi:hypothetical protein